jgi:cytoskeletal protein RodZ
MDNKPIINKPKFLSIKLFLFSFSIASVLWIWGLISAQELIKTTVQNYNASLGQSAATAAPSNVAAPSVPMASTSLKKVQLPATPTPKPALRAPAANQPASQPSAPITNTGSSRP